MKKIVTHLNPDLDAVASVWLIKRFLPGWEKAEVGFCEPDSTIDGRPVDSSSDILHVDVGGGKLDHHQTGEYLSAASLCFDYVLAARRGRPLSPLAKRTLERMVQVVTEVDNARDLNWPEVKEVRCSFYLHVMIWGVRGWAKSDQEAMDFGLKGLDAVFLEMKQRLKAEEELKKGIEFRTPWGRAVGVETGNDQILWEGEKKGYCLVIRKDPKTGGVRIYSRYDSSVDLTKAYNKFKDMDPESDWFLHASKKLLLNMATSKNMRPTKLSLKQLITILKRRETSL